MADGSITFDVEILDKRAKQKLEELDDLIKSSGDSMDSELSHQAQKFINDWERASVAYEQSMEKIKVKTKEISDYQKVLDNAKMKNPDLKISDEATAKLKGMQLDLEKLQNNAQRYGLQMDKSGIGAGNLLQKIKGTTEETKKATKATETLKRSTSGIGDSLKGGLKSVIRLTTAMLGMRGIITGINKITREWYASNDLGAKQAQANMSAMTSGIVNLLAPALTFVTNLMGTLFGYINAIARAFFGVDLLAKNTSKNLGVGAGNAKKLGKEIKGFTASFDEADVASGNIADNLDGAGGGGGGNIDIEPNIKTPDLSKFKAQLEEMFKPFLDTMKSIDFEPLKNSFKSLADTAKESLKIIGESFVRVTNNSVAPFIKLMVEDIVPKGLNTINRVLKRLNPVIDRLLKDFVEPLINWFLLDFTPTGLELVFSIFEALGGILAVVIESFNVFWDSAVGRSIGEFWGTIIRTTMELLTGIFTEIIESVDYFFTKLEEGDPFAQALAISLGIIVTALIAWGVAMVAINTATALFNAISPFGWIVIAITAVIAVILILYKNWEDIVKFFEETLGNIGSWFGEKWQGIKDGFENLVTSIKTWWNETVDKLKEGWNNFLEKGKGAIQGILDFFGGMKDKVVGYFKFLGEFWGTIIGGMLGGVKDVIGNIKGIFNGLVEFVSGVFSGDWKRAWNGIVQIFDNIIGGIANIFKIPINAIIDGINVFLRGLNRIKIPSWVPGVGGKGFNISEIPRLAKGASLTHQTTATMAEYPNARTNPEIVSPQKIMRETLAQALAENNQLGSVGNQEITIVTPVVIDGNEIARVVNKFNMKDLLQGNGGGLGWNM